MLGLQGASGVEVPGSVITASIAAALFHLPIETIGSHFGGIPGELPMPHLPDLAWDRVVAVLHGNTSVLTDSYSERGDAVGRKKQTVHYRTIKQIENITSAFPEVAAMLSELRLSVKHHEDPISREQVIRDAAAM